MEEFAPVDDSSGRHPLLRRGIPPLEERWHRGRHGGSETVARLSTALDTGSLAAIGSDLYSRRRTSRTVTNFGRAMEPRAERRWSKTSRKGHVDLPRFFADIEGTAYFVAKGGANGASYGSPTEPNQEP